MNTRIDLSISTNDRFVPLVFEASDPEHPEWNGEISAELVCNSADGLRIEIGFNYGWDKPTTILASLDAFALALAALRAEVAAHVSEPDEAAA